LRRKKSWKIRQRSHTLKIRRTLDILDNSDKERNMQILLRKRDRLSGVNYLRKPITLLIHDLSLQVQPFCKFRIFPYYYQWQPCIFQYDTVNLNKLAVPCREQYRNNVFKLQEKSGNKNKILKWK